ncbi:MAG: NADH:flavin oxidoreductase [Deltaproteobacteria bacterium]|nr:NADH:flavin oxidoreductase [Deltaproteobacteria bacterium]
MSLLFTPMSIGRLSIANRIVHSATYEGMAEEDGTVTSDLLKRYRSLARGRVGLIIPGYMYIHKTGRAMKFQTGIHNDQMIPGLRKLTDAVHKNDGKIVFQLNHAGRQTEKKLSGVTPMSPSSVGRDPVYFVKPRRMNDKDIANVVEWFAAAAARAVSAGADGIQLHAAHGYLLNQFLSPFFNRRADVWGGTAEKRFRMLKSVIVSVQKEMPDNMPLLVKMNAMDYAPGPGITPELAARYAKWMEELGVSCIEVSCGSALYSFMSMCRGEVPVDDMAAGLPFWKRPVGRLMLKNMEGKFDLEEGYNVAAAGIVKEAVSELLVAVVGGLRRVSRMEDVLKKGYADLISMSRPFIREPFLAKRFFDGKQEEVGCVSCNKCLAAAATERKVKCYYKGDK